jgi:hypothetical protein
MSDNESASTAADDTTNSVEEEHIDTNGEEKERSYCRGAT